MDETKLFSDIRLGYTPEKSSLYQKALAHNIPAVRPQMGQFLSFVVSLVSPRRILEIGTGSGYSTLWLLRYLSQGACIVTLERDSRRYREALALLYGYPVEVVCAEACEFLSGSEEIFDMVFLDAEKRMYPRLLPLVTDHLAQGGLLVVDNLLGKNLHHRRRTPLPSEAALEEFYEAVVSSSCYRVFAFSWEDGILVAQRV
ncbi:MAG: class I SAM-dependent methyltransferase [Brevinematales bacterium]|nr:class I SAM-dependent methyltransferase [Brevinematales bacterium]